MANEIYNCVKFFTHFEQDGKEYYIYELCTDGDLTGIKSKMAAQRFNEKEAKYYIDQIVSAMNDLHNMRVVHRDIKPDNVFMTRDKMNKLVCKLGDFGTARLVNENLEFVLAKNESINQTQAGSGYFMSPEMKNDRPNGLKTDIWSLGITIGVILGLEDAFLDGYKGGIPGFCKDCAAGKHDLYLSQKNIYLSPILKDLLKNMLMVDQNKRFSMKQIMDHKFVVMAQADYEKGYDQWADKQIPKLKQLSKALEEMLSKIEPKYKGAYIKFDDDTKQFFYKLKNEQKDLYMSLGAASQQDVMSVREGNRDEFLNAFNGLSEQEMDYINNLEDTQKFPYLMLFADDKKNFKSLDNSFKDNFFECLDHYDRVSQVPDNHAEAVEEFPQLKQILDAAKKIINQPLADVHKVGTLKEAWTRLHPMFPWNRFVAFLLQYEPSIPKQPHPIEHQQVD